MRVIIAALVAAFVFPGGARAQMPCGPAAAVASHLSGGQYGERPFATGVMPDGRAFTLWANPETGTWTGVLTQPDGAVSCVATVGTRFSPGAVPAPPPKPGKDT